MIVFAVYLFMFDFLCGEVLAALRASAEQFGSSVRRFIAVIGIALRFNAKIPLSLRSEQILFCEIFGCEKWMDLWFFSHRILTFWGVVIDLRKTKISKGIAGGELSYRTLIFVESGGRSHSS